MPKSIALYFLLFISCSAIAQVPVSKEPRHHVVFENNKIRILNVLLPPGDTTGYHLHATPSVFISLSTAKTGAQAKEGTSITSGLSMPGNISFENLNPPNIRIHRVWNEDTTMFHVVDVELFTKKIAFDSPPLTLPSTRIITDTPWVRTYKMTLNKDEEIALPKNKNAFLVIAFYNATVDINNKNSPGTLKIVPGDFFWINPGEQFTITNRQKNPAAFALLEIK